MSHDPVNAIQSFEEILSGEDPDWEKAMALVATLEKEGRAEEASARLRQKRFAKGLQTQAYRQLKARLGFAAGRSKERRASGNRLDPDRGILRLHYSRGAAVAPLNPAQFLHLLIQTLRRAGLDPALSLERSPRPLVALGHPLPSGTTGCSEWADVDLSPMPKDAEDVLLARLDSAAPEGIAFLGATALPPFATPVLELSRLAHWAWPCPPELRELAERKLAAFESADSFSIEKMGKDSGQKKVKLLEVRPMVQSLAWAGDTLRFALHVSAKDALNPQKLLSGILGVESASIQGLERIAVELAEDDRLSQAERFEPKLRNIYEDAVLLSSGPNLQIIDEDEDEPLRLG